MSDWISVQGNCPMGCGQKLIAVIGKTTTIRCSDRDCLAPHRVQRILDEQPAAPAINPEAGR